MSDTVKIISAFQNKSYKSIFPEMEVYVQSNYFLQFNAYTVYLPSRKLSAENIFEDSIMKLLRIAPLSAEEVAEKLCLKVDFVKFMLKKISAREKRNILPRLILTARDTGEILPRIFSAECKAVKLSGTTIIQDDVSARTLKTPAIFVEPRSRVSETLPQGILREIATENNFSVENFVIPSTYSEPIFLHVKAILQSASDDFFLASLGDTQHDEFLHDYMNRNHTNILSNLKWYGARS